MDPLSLAADLERVRTSLTPAEWEQRNANADAAAAVLDQVVARIEKGASVLSAIREVVPDAKLTTWAHRLERYLRLGRGVRGLDLEQAVWPTGATHRFRGTVWVELAGRHEPVGGGIPAVDGSLDPARRREVRRPEARVRRPRWGSYFSRAASTNVGVRARTRSAGATAIKKPRFPPLR